MAGTNVLSITPPIEFSEGWRRMKIDNVNTALLFGSGTTSAPVTAGTQADKNFIGWWLKTTATSGTTRGEYLRLYLSSGAGGEALRVFTTVENAAPADTVNGAHISLNFGSSAGNVTGEGQAVRATLHLGNRTMTGTIAAVKAEIWSDGASSDSSNAAFIRMSNGGNATGIAAFDTNGFLFNIDGLTAGTGKLLRASAPATLAASLRVKVGATVYYLPLYSAAA